MANGNFAGGDGTGNNPYLIEDAHDLNAIRGDLNAHYKLVNDIDLNIAPYSEGEGWVPLGDNNLRFAGRFDGGGYTIQNLFINRPSIDHQGLFALTTNTSEIKDVGISDADITCGEYSGVLVGRSQGPIANVYSTGNIVGVSVVGGLVGYQVSEIKNAHSAVNVTASGHGGALVGRSFAGLIFNSYSIGVAPHGLTGSVGSSTTVNSYWDKELSGVGSSASGVGLTTTEMKTAQTFIDVSWDTETTDDGKPVWKFHEHVGKDYPRLWFQPDWYKLRHFIKANEKTYTIDSSGNLITPQVSATPTEQEFMEHGMESLERVFMPSNRVSKTAKEITRLGSGMTFSTKITPTEFSRQIKRIRNTR